MSLCDELKRRDVYKISIAHVIVAWLIRQLANVILNKIEMPV